MNLGYLDGVRDYFMDNFMFYNLKRILWIALL